jgi:hypothetical protein
VIIETEKPEVWLGTLSSDDDSVPELQALEYGTQTVPLV